jgi:hypothetical protein
MSNNRRVLYFGSGCWKKLFTSESLRLIFCLASNPNIHRQKWECEMWLSEQRKRTYVWCRSETFSSVWSRQLNSCWRYRRMWEVIWGRRNGSFWKMRTAQSILSWRRMITGIADVVGVFVVAVSINSLWRSLGVRDCLTCYHMSDCFSVKPFFHFLHLSKQFIIHHWRFFTI